MSPARPFLTRGVLRVPLGLTKTLPPYAFLVIYKKLPTDAYPAGAVLYRGHCADRCSGR